MIKKIFTFLIVGTFLFTSLTNLPTLGMKTDIYEGNMDEKSVSKQIAWAFLWISSIRDHVEYITCGNISIGGFLSGLFFANLNVMYDKVWEPYQIDGMWHVEIGCSGIGANRGKNYCFFDNKTWFDYGMNEHPPASIYENETREIEPGYYLVYCLIDIFIDVYKDHELFDKIEVRKFYFKIINYFNKNNNLPLNKYIQLSNQLSNQKLISSYKKSPRIPLVLTSWMNWGLAFFFTL